MSAPITSVATRLNVATITQYLSSQTSLAASLTGGDKRRAVLLRSVPHWDGPAEPVWGDGHTARISAAPSPLAVHELVLSHLVERAEGSDGPAVLVILTDREQSELDPAILARTHKKRIDTVDSWDVVREAFGAEQVDPRLKEASWASEALLDATPPGGWPPLAGGMLARSTALSALALRRLRLGRYDTESSESRRSRAGDVLDTHTLLGWSLSPGGPERLLELRGPERVGLREFLGEQDQAGPAGKALLALVEAEHGEEAVAFGLVCGALWLHAAPDADTYRARGRAERWFGEQPPAVGEELDALASAFGRATEEYVGTLLTAAARAGVGDADEAREARRISDTVLDRASALVRRFGAETAAQASPLLPTGLEARFAAAGRALSAGRPGPVAEAVGALSAHKRAEGPQIRVRIERVRMGQRLVQWLAGDPAVESGTAAACIERHISETGWVDQALEYIEAGGDPDPALKSAYDRLAACVRERRHEIDRNFARTLATWTAAGTPPGSMLAVESFLDRVVKPIVRGGDGRRIMLLVLDGMSAAVAGELAEELRSSWAEFDPVKEGAPRRRAMAAALPTLTAVSRTSLFAGRLMKGTQADEKRLFPAQKLWAGAPAAVFHKDDLRAESAGETFGPDLSEALADGRTHVAVVLNAIDDKLGKEQKLGDGSWQVHHVPGLVELLRVAAVQGMAVLITSDHGHVVDRHGSRVDAGNPESARHRTPGGTLGKTEVALCGPRVVWPDPGTSIVALWDADSRYTALKAGYHGGASLAEFTIPVLAFLPFGATPPREWRELGDQRPTWWFLDERAPRPAPARPDPAPVSRKPTRQKPSKAEAELAETHDSLFDVTVVPAPLGADKLVTTALVGPAEALVTALPASGAFQDQVGLLARKPPMEKVEKAILALLDAGGTLPVTAVAQRVGYPATRADGFAAVLRQLLNFDGVQVLETLPDGRTLRLHQGLLREQFGLG
ncbi:BREX-2 system phosphatase PglZ [Streptomyces sp. XD-27]|uniref:BREX-2 system phosphatase PglZ n=1 Tax=Streptomyces sp. XD-27 TaxID=3062779 RepID=UPI0026F43268|nr:BREX-2 system phosphatase PglZ [Streptomyces sp. XD-27]WKX69247.1 BREX-2 system phosphatase PglZ [Streptomyces sp. XD-27]